MEPLVLITGPFRSGTSAVAQIVHRIGFIAVTTMTMPVPPRWHCDWEDHPAMIALHDILSKNNRSFRFRKWFRQYLEARMVHAVSVSEFTSWHPLGICIKSPMYAMFAGEIAEECRRVSKPLKIIVCERDRAERRASLEVVNDGAPEPLKKAIRRIAGECERASEKIVGDNVIRVNYGMLLLKPKPEAERIAAFVGADAGFSARVIESRTEYAPCPC